MSFTLNRKTDYALVALACLAKEKMGADEPLSARQIGEKYDLPLPLLMNALKDLQRADLVCSRRGAGGGYYLCRQPEEINLQEVIEAMEGPVSVTLCSDAVIEEEDCVTCQIVSLCPINDPMKKLNHMFLDFLRNITLKTLIAHEEMIDAPLGVTV